MNKYLFLFAFLFSISASFAEDVTPYLQSPTPTSIYICWETSTDTTTSLVYRKSGGETQIRNGKWQLLGENVMWHWVKLDDLSPNTEYSYQIKSEYVETPNYKFQTIPENGFSTGHVRFGLRSDCQSRPEVGTKVFNALVEKMKELYGEDLSTEVDLIFTTGDIVGSGSNLYAYKPEYFTPLYPISPNVPSMVSIGNHEGESSNYYNYMKYEDLAGPEGEAYYKFQIGRVLFIALNSNGKWRNERQIEWLSQTLDSADTDETIDWVFAFCHHPGHSSVWSPGNTPYIQNRVIPLLAQHNKAELLAYGHSHDYERGAHLEATLRTMCVGGAAGGLDRWSDNVWVDYAEIQRSFDHHHFVIVDVDIENRSYTIQTWSLGTPDKWLNSVKIDSFTRKLDAVIPPQTPQIAAVEDSVDLPLVVEASLYVGEEPLQTSQFQLTTTSGDYSQPVLDEFRDFEHYFLDTGAPNWEPINQHQGIDLTKCEIKMQDAVWPGIYYCRVRYRDKNLLWSDWSEEAEINIRSTGFEPVQAYNKTIAFDGRESYVEVTDDLSTAQLPERFMTIEAWVKLKSHVTWGGYIGAFEDNGNYEKGWVLGNYNKKFSFGLASTGRDDGDGMMTYLAAPSEFDYNKWYHVAATYNGSVMKLYVNGYNVATSFDQNGDILYDLNSFFDIGVYHDDNEFNVLYGQLDDVRLWDTVLSESVIQQWMFKEVNESHPLYNNLVSYWDFNKFSGSTLEDKKGTNDGAIIDVGVHEYVASTAPIGVKGLIVKTKQQTSVGQAGSDLAVTISSNPNRTNFLGLYQSGVATGAPVDYDEFPDGVFYRSSVFWGAKEFGGVSAKVEINYGGIKHVDDSENLVVLTRPDAGSPWIDITSEVNHDMTAKSVTMENQSEFGEYTLGWENFLTSVDEKNAMPDEFVLFENYPNPFNPVTQIRFNLAANTNVELKIYDISGRQIRTLVGNHAMVSGTHEIKWDGLTDGLTPVSSGIYFCRIKTKEFDKTIKMMLVR